MMSVQINKRLSSKSLLAGAMAIAMGMSIGFSDGSFTSGGSYVYAAEHEGGGKGKGPHGGEQGGQGGPGDRGQGGRSAHDVLGEDEDGGEDSDRPDWAGVPGREGKPGRGNVDPGQPRGDIFGDMYVLLRDDNGVPILTPEGWVQPLDADGNPIPLDDEGHPIDESLTVEVDIGRLNVGRSPSQVLDARLNEVFKLLEDATAVTTDAAGRLIITTADGDKTVDSPLENLGLYVTLVNDGTLGVNIDPSVLGDLAHINDGTLTVEDYDTAAAFLAAASDKSVTMTIDQIVYVNTILGVAGTIEQNDIQYIDYSSFSYDRSDTYGSVTTDVLVQQPDGTWQVETVNIYDVVFSNTDYSGTGGVDVYTQAADDARAVIDYIHEYAIPETP